MFLLGEEGVEKRVVLEYLVANPLREFLDLLFDVSDEGIQSTASNKHDSVDRFLFKIHQHYYEGLDGVGPGVLACET